MSKDKKEITQIDDEDSGEGGLPPLEESYASILRRLGVDVSDMSLADVRNMIHDYAQEGRIKGAKVIDIKTGKSRQTYAKNSESDREYSVKSADDTPVSEAELLRAKTEREYSERSEKRKDQTPQPPFDPKPPKPTPL